MGYNPNPKEKKTKKKKNIHIQKNKKPRTGKMLKSCKMEGKTESKTWGEGMKPKETANTEKTI